MNTPVSDKDIPLRDDIRSLGRLLGDTVREQEGEEVFAVVERIRQTSVRLNQGHNRELDPDIRSELEAILNALPRDTMISVVRAFSYFLHLANIAEDQHHIRRSRAHQRAGSPPREGSMAHALAATAAAGIDDEQLKAFFADALVCPVLTAHPTEVQRKSILINQMRIARLLDARDRMQLTAEESEENEDTLRRNSPAGDSLAPVCGESG